MELLQEYKCRNIKEYKELYLLHRKQGFKNFELLLGELCYQNYNHTILYEGYCEVCNKKSKFKLNFDNGGLIKGRYKIPNFRESLVCKSCLLNNRQRYIVSKVLKEYKPDMKIYMYEFVTPTFKIVSKKIRNVVGSEFLGDNLKSGDIVNNVVHQDAMNMSYNNKSFDLLISNDVFEHVSDYKKAFQEAFRILKLNGKLIITVPFYVNKINIENRAKIINNKLIYIKEPIYHGNPVSNNGSLVFNIFGWDILNILKDCGFSDAYIKTYYSIENAYIGNLPLYIEAIK